MIKINALYFLLLIELLVIFAGLVAFLVFRDKKRAVVYREGKKELASAHAATAELQKQAAALKAGDARQATTKGDVSAVKTAPAPNENAQDLEACKREITVLEEKVKEKARLLIELQAKLDSVEKEYLLLYQQHQAQELDKS